MKLTPHEWGLLRKCTYWTADAWAKPISQYLESCSRDEFSGKTVLEVGAGHLSSLSPLFAHLGAQGTCGWYKESRKHLVIDYNEKMRKSFNIDNEIYYQRVDAFNVSGRYDFIVMKSVVGGLFRTHNSAMADVHQYIETVRKNNLNPGGQLILIDNGKSILESGLKNLGSRADKWRFFHLDDIRNPKKLYKFGVFSSFSLKTRNERIGSFTDRLMYFVDVVIGKVIKSKPTVILHVYDSLQ